MVQGQLGIHMQTKQNLKQKIHTALNKWISRLSIKDKNKSGKEYKRLSSYLNLGKELLNGG